MDKKFFERLQTVSKKFPHLRLGQLLENAIHHHSGGQELFYISDDQLIEALEKYARNAGR